MGSRKDLARKRKLARRVRTRAYGPRFRTLKQWIKHYRKPRAIDASKLGGVAGVLANGWGMDAFRMAIFQAHFQEINAILAQRVELPPDLMVGVAPGGVGSDGKAG